SDSPQVPPSILPVASAATVAEPRSTTTAPAPHQGAHATATSAAPTTNPSSEPMPTRTEPGEPTTPAGGWTMFHGSAQHAGQSPGVGPESANVRWTYAPGDGYGVSRSAPVVGADGTVYLARECQGTFP